jgi:hypothetical protein
LKQARRLAPAVGAIALLVVIAAAQPAVGMHARPKSATPLRVPLVPAFAECLTPNRTHALIPPVQPGSCSPPVQASPNLTFGSPDANGAPANGSAFIRFKLLGVQGGPDDEDVEMTTSVVDVRCRAGVTACGNSNAQDGADYVGELETIPTLRITDHANGTGGTETATMADFDLPYAVSCLATSDTATGATCDTVTSFDAQIPGAVPEGKRMLVQLDQMSISDGGPDGVAATPDNETFLVQGVFAP